MLLTIWHIQVKILLQNKVAGILHNPIAENKKESNRGEKKKK